MDYDRVANEIMELVGGSTNIQSITHCMTRLRFYLHDKERVDVHKLEALPLVMGTLVSGGQFQVVIGNAVAEVYGSIKHKLKL